MIRSLRIVIWGLVQTNSGLCLNFFIYAGRVTTQVSSFTLCLCHWKDDSPQLFPVQCCSSPGSSHLLSAASQVPMSLDSTQTHTAIHVDQQEGSYLVFVMLWDRLHHISPLRSSSTLLRPLTWTSRSGMLKTPIRGHS